MAYSLLKFHYEDHSGNFTLLHQTAQAQAAQTPNFTTYLHLAAISMLRGKYTEAETILQQAENYPHEEASGQALLDRFRLICRYERYERMPGEINIFITEVAVQKEKTGGLPRKQVSPLPPAATPELNELVDFLNIRLQHWEWRCLRNLLRGARFAPDTSGIVNIYHRQLQVCHTLFQQGDLFAGICAADFCRSASATQEAIDWMTRTHDLAEQNHDLLTQANCQLWVGDWLSAPYSWPLAWNFALQSSSSQSSTLPSAVESVEFTFPTAENIIQARQAWEQAQALFTEAGCERGLAHVLLRWGYLAVLEGNFSEVSPCTQQARTLFLQTGDELGVWLAETHELMAMVAENKMPEAQALARSIGSWGQRSGNVSWSVGLGLLVSRFARHLMLRKGMAELALKAFRIARELYLAVGANYHAAQHLTDMGEVYKATGQIDAAIVYFEQAADEIEAVLSGDWKNFQDELNTAIHTRTGVIMLMSDNFLLGMRRMDADLMDRSIGRMQMACQRLREEASPEQVAAMPQVGQVFGLYDQMAEQALVVSPLYRAKNLRDKGDLDGFEREWQKAYTALEKVSPGQQNVLAYSVWGMKRDWPKAAEAIRQYIGVGGANAGFSGELLQFMEQFGEQGKEEIRLQQYRVQTQALSGLVRTKQFAEALTYSESLRQSFGEQWWLREEAPWLILCDCGEMMEGLNRLDEAMALFDLGLEQLEIRRNQLSQDELKVALSGSQNTQFLYTYAARAAMAAKQPERAFQYAEQGKARSLLDLMAENRLLATGNPKSQEWILKLRETDARRSILTGQLAKEHANPLRDESMLQLLGGQIAEVETLRSQLEQELIQANPAFSIRPIDEPLTYDVNTVMAALDSDTLLVEYLLAGDDLLIWAVASNRILHAEAFKVEDWRLKSEINHLRQTVIGRQPWQSAALALSTRLLQPIATALRLFPKVILVPHGPLHLLPFQLLPFNGSPLGLLRTLCYLPSASALRFLEKVVNLSDARVLAIGNPTGDLPAAAIEALFVAQQYGPAANTLIGAAATEAALRECLPQANLLHLATHGNLSEEAPLQTYLSLADHQQLTLQEMMGLQLNADLVVLSACDTARGTQTGGDDVLGLTRGLIAGGAKSAVVSLWPVNDVSTALLMGRFYQALKKGISPAEALRLAQTYLFNLDKQHQLLALENLEVSITDVVAPNIVNASRAVRDISGLTTEEEPEMIDYNHPYYWAGFILVGW